MVLIVDDDELIRDSLGGLMKGAGFPALTFASAEEFLNSGEEEHSMFDRRYSYARNFWSRTPGQTE